MSPHNQGQDVAADHNSHSDAVHPDVEVAQLLNHIYSLHRKDMDFRLHGSPYEDLLHDLDDPHLHLPPVIHVAGTNGKGSSLAALRALLEGAGRSVHMMTSPHLLRFNERIMLAGSHITDAQLKPLLRHVIKVNNGREITFFELTTALAFVAMSRHDADYCLIETGCGGRLDSSNIIPNPILTAITAIGYDHQLFLGDSLTEISGEKAGIMKPSAPCIIGFQPDADIVHPVFKSKAQDLGIALTLLDATHSDAAPLSNMRGVHQRHNTALAMALYDALRGFSPDLPPAPVASLQNVDWPGRLQCLRRRDGQEIWFDGAHNTAGATMLAQQCAQWRAQDPGMPIHLIVTLGAGKDAQAFLSPLLPHAENIYIADLKTGPAPRTASDVISTVKNTNLTPFTPDILHNLQGRIIVCGSLYFYAKITENLNI